MEGDRMAPRWSSGLDQNTESPEMHIVNLGLDTKMALGQKHQANNCRVFKYWESNSLFAPTGPTPCMSTQLVLGPVMRHFHSVRR